jgi:phage tail-like protein
MALSKEQLKKQYPLPAYNFRVQIGAETYAFAQVTGLSFQYETMTYRHGLSPQEGPVYAPGLLQPINLTLQRSVVQTGSVLLEWISGVQLDKARKQDLTIDLCDENGAPLVSWMARDAFPISMEAPSFDAANNEVAIESIQLLATSLQVTYHDSGQTGGTTSSGGITDLTGAIAGLL